MALSRGATPRAHAAVKLSFAVASRTAEMNQVHRHPILR